MTKLVPLLAVAMVLAAGQSVAMDLVSHVARYRMDVEQVKIPGVVASTGGDFILRVEERCDDWILFTRMEFSLDTAEGDVLHMESMGGIEESRTGNSLRFRSEHLINGQPVETLSGTAKGGRVTFTSPRNAEPANLPVEVKFPFDAMKHSLQQIADGKKFQSYEYFDGSSQDAVRVTEVLIGSAEPLSRAPQGDSDLLSGGYWRVVSSFFPLSNQDEEPMSVNTYDVFENGVTTRLTLDVGVLTARGVLTHVERLPPPTCGDGA